MAIVFPFHYHKPLTVSAQSRQNPSSGFFKPDSDQFLRKVLSTTTSINLLRHRSFILNGLNNRDSEPINSPDDEANSLGVKAALSMLRFYKREISPLMPNSCRYVPTCSEYSMIAYKKYGVAKGTILTAWRLCRCNPLAGSGFDPPRWFDESSNLEE